MASFTVSLDIINAALIEIGESQLTSAELTANSLDRAKVANQQYDETVDEVLADSFWEFAKKYHALSKSSPQPNVIPNGFSTAFDLPNNFIRPVRMQNNEEFDIYSNFSAITAGPNTCSTVNTTFTSIANTLSVGDYVILTSGSQKDEIRRVVTDTSVDVVELDAPFTANQIAGTTWSKATGDKIYLITDASAPKLEYIARITTPSLWSPLFKQSIIKRLAAKFALSITHSRGLAVSLLQEYQALLIRAEVVSGQSSNRPHKIESRVLIDVRRGVSTRNDKVISTGT